MAGAALVVLLLLLWGDVWFANVLSGVAIATLLLAASFLAVNNAFRGAKRELTLIDGGHWLGVLLLQGAVIGWLGL